MLCEVAARAHLNMADGFSCAWNRSHRAVPRRVSVVSPCGFDRCLHPFKKFFQGDVEPLCHGGQSSEADIAASAFQVGEVGTRHAKSRCARILRKTPLLPEVFDSKSEPDLLFGVVRMVGLLFHLWFPLCSFASRAGKLSISGHETAFWHENTPSSDKKELACSISPVRQNRQGAKHLQIVPERGFVARNRSIFCT